MRYQTSEKPLTREEIDRKMQEMIEKRNRHMKEAREKFGVFHKQTTLPKVERPLTRGEVDTKMREMQERRERDKKELKKVFPNLYSDMYSNGNSEEPVSNGMTP